MKYTVLLYRYDLTGGLAKEYSAGLLGMHIEGVWHTSIVVYNKEYYFDGGVGITTELHPGQTRFGTPYKIDTLGQTTKTEMEFSRWIDTLNCNNSSARHSNLAFGPNDYHLLDNNCNHFTQAASRFLLNQDIPSDIRQMIPTLLSTPLGCILRPMLERATQNTNSSLGQSNYNSSCTSNAAPEPSETPNTSTCVERIGKGLMSTKTSLSEDENDDLLTMQAMLESNPYLHEESRESKELRSSSNSMTGLELTCKALNVVESILQKIIAFPCERKYRTLSTKSKTYQSYLLPLEEYGVREMLRLAGFIERQRSVIVNDHSKNNITDDDKVQPDEMITEWVLTDEKGNTCVLQRILEAIQECKHNIENSDEIDKEADKQASISKSKDDDLGEVKSKFMHEQSEKILEYNNNNKNNNSEQNINFKEEIPSSIVCTINNRTPNCKKCQSARNVNVENSDLISVDKNKELIDVRRYEEQTLTEKSPREADRCHSTNVHVESSNDRGGKETTASSETNVLHYNLINVAHELSSHEHGDNLLHLASALSGEPIRSLEQLMKWSEPLLCAVDSNNVLSLIPPFPYTRAVSRVTSTSRTSELLEYENECKQCSEGEEEQHHLRLLVCHDMQGGYLETDNAQFSITLTPSTSKATAVTTTNSALCSKSNHYLEVLAQAYTVRYWPYVDYFVYFSHHRVTIPPADWIASAHQHGVPILGTLIMEGASGMHEMNTILLSNAHNMALVVRQLVRLCNYYRFDGYLLNFECNVDPLLVPRVQLFVTVLREELNKPHNVYFNEEYKRNTSVNDRSNNSNLKKKEHTNKGKRYSNNEQNVNFTEFSVTQKRFVIWYDALTTQGEVRYQNALTSLNKPFYDRADGILLNYFWHPHQLFQTIQETTGHTQRSGVFVGIDVFGRHMYDGGQFDSVKSVQRIASAGLSVGLFAPGWTLEMCNYAKPNRKSITQADLYTECVSSPENVTNSESDDIDGNRINSLEYYRQMRLEFEVRDLKLWEPMLFYFTKRTRALENVNKLHILESKGEETIISGNSELREHCTWLWTCFCDAVGLTFFVNGEPVNWSLQNKKEMCNSIWCQRAFQQDTPPLSYSSSSSSSSSSSLVNNCFDHIECTENAKSNQAKQHVKCTNRESSSFFYLYSLDLGKIDQLECENARKFITGQVSHRSLLTKEVNAEWCQSAAWFGNRSLRFTLAPLKNAVITDWIVKTSSRKLCYTSNMQFVSHVEKDVFVNSSDDSSNNDNTVNKLTDERIQEEVILVDVIYKTNHMEHNKTREQRGLLIQLEHRLHEKQETTVIGSAKDMIDINNSIIETVSEKLIGNKSNSFITVNDVISHSNRIDKQNELNTEVVEVNESDENSCRMLFVRNCNNLENTENYNSKEWSLVRYLLRMQCKTGKLTSLDAQNICKERYSANIEKNTESMVTAVAIVNKSTEHSLCCQIGGVGVTCVLLIGSNHKRATSEEFFALPSPLMPLCKHKWLNFSVENTHFPQKFILCLQNVQETVNNALQCKEHFTHNDTLHKTQTEQPLKNTNSAKENNDTSSYEKLTLIAVTANVTIPKNVHAINEFKNNDEQITSGYNYNVYLGQHHVNVYANNNLIIPINVMESSCKITEVYFYVIGNT